MSLTKKQSTILNILREGGLITNHVKPNNKTCGRLIDKSKNAVLNISARTVHQLLDKDRIQKIDGNYVYKSIRQRKFSKVDLQEFHCTYDGKQWYLVKDVTMGKAKYKFWKEVKKKVNPNLPYTQVRIKKNTRNEKPEHAGKNKGA